MKEKYLHITRCKNPYLYIELINKAAFSALERFKTLSNSEKCCIALHFIEKISHFNTQYKGVNIKFLAEAIFAFRKREESITISSHKTSIRSKWNRC